MHKFWHIFATVGLTVAGAAVPVLHQAVASNPTAALILGGAWAILGNLLKSPVETQQ